MATTTTRSCFGRKRSIILCGCRSIPSTAGSSTEPLSMTDRINIVQDASIVCLGIDDDPILEALQDGEGAPSVPRFALWLWGYWGRLRGRLFRSPLRYGSLKHHEEWERVEAAAASMVDAIVAEAARLEEANQARKSWRL